MKDEEVSLLIQHRLEQARTALEDAQFLFDGNRSSQSVVNRAYYAMFYSSLALLQKIGTVPSKHTGVVSLFDTEFIAKGTFPKELSKDFHKAFELRQISDYKTVAPLSRERVEESLAKAKNFYEAVRKYLDEQENK